MATKLLLSKAFASSPNRRFRSPPRIDASAENVLAKTIELASAAVQLAFIGRGVWVLNMFFPFKERF
jgi:hypothetical protein